MVCIAMEHWIAVEREGEHLELDCMGILTILQAIHGHLMKCKLVYKVVLHLLAYTYYLRLILTQ